MRTVIGIDPSLRATGLAAIRGTSFGLATVKTRPVLGGPAATAGRVHLALERILALVPEDTALVVIEGPSYGSQHGARFERAGLYWMLLDQLRGRGLEVVIVAPRTRAKYATGDGSADKRTVLRTMRERFPVLNVRDDNQADALALACAGSRWLGAARDGGLDRAQTAAYRNIHWPEEAA
ncbi:crossover junction endodeoxyribonuclease RuvC [Gryllotalpicola protaetiae]|uniref:crossover junction endodeoxyribonuclease RuvC n=1 Tax=Gryllotalpicola protaetiae TaxID=2419771 RepID=UPI0013C43E7E|nr:crossover junction endodeoxyribonuclease RuvC [Gryllotalpicola protaetiae]